MYYYKWSVPVTLQGAFPQEEVGIYAPAINTAQRYNSQRGIRKISSAEFYLTPSACLTLRKTFFQGANSKYWPHLIHTATKLVVNEWFTMKIQKIVSIK